MASGVFRNFEWDTPLVCAFLASSRAPLTHQLGKLREKHVTAELSGVIWA